MQITVFFPSVCIMFCCFNYAKLPQCGFNKGVDLIEFYSNMMSSRCDSTSFFTRSTLCEMLHVLPKTCGSDLSC